MFSPLLTKMSVSHFLMSSDSPGIWREKQNLPAFHVIWWLHEHGGREDMFRGWDSGQTDPVAHTNERTKGN